MKIYGAHQSDPFVLRNMISCSFILFEIFKHLMDGKHLNMFGSGPTAFRLIEISSIPESILGHFTMRLCNRPLCGVSHSLCSHVELAGHIRASSC